MSVPLFVHSIAIAQVCGSGICYAPNPGPGCNVQECCEEVCVFAPDCCVVEWDQSCVSYADNLCLPFGVCGLSTAGSCVAIHSNPACNDPLCCELVCSADPACCESEWDSLCVQRAITNCGTPNDCSSATGSCYEVHAGGGCSDPECCDLICGLDPECCNAGWDFFCVSAANCYCAGGCNVTCPANSIQELETCGLKRNDPCYNPGTTIQGQSIVPGLPLCARLFVDQLSGGVIDADVDVFVAQLGAEGSGLITTTLSLTSKKQAWAALVPAPPIGGCNPLAMAVASVSSTNTILGTTELCVPAGKYWVVVSAGTFPNIGQAAPFSCADGRYLVSVSFTPGCNAPCGDPAISCFTPHATPGCGDPRGCCQQVCATDPFCCEIRWDNVCAVAAANQCGAPPPANNFCIDATPVTAGATPFSTILATTDGPALPPSCDEGNLLSFVNDVWFSFTATRSGPVRISTCGETTFDSRLAVYDGIECPPRTLVACNDDDPSCAAGLFSTVLFNAVCENVYLIRLGARLDNQGVGVLDLEELGAGGCQCVGDITGDGVVDGADLAMVLGNWNGSGTGDLNNDGFVDGIDIAIILGNWGAC